MITVDIIEDCAKKIMPHNLNRYYVLTTHTECEPGECEKAKLKEIKDRIGCQMIVNGVIPTIQYYLRLLEKPSSVFVPYAELLKNDFAISHEHRAAWNDIVIGKV